MNNNTDISNISNMNGNTQLKMEYLYKAIEDGWTVKKVRNSTNKFELSIPINETTHKNEKITDNEQVKPPSRRAISAPIVRKKTKTN